MYRVLCHASTFSLAVPAGTSRGSMRLLCAGCSMDMSLTYRGLARSLRCAIIGDIIGSLFEGTTVRGDYPNSSVTGYPRNSPLVAKALQTGSPLTVASLDLPVAGSKVTDDSVLSLAVADHLVGSTPLTDSLKTWFKSYPNAGYGAGFTAWAQSTKTGNDSWGNGAAMRVSPIIDLADSLDVALSLAEQSAQPTHNHPEAIEGAQAIALCGYLIKRKASNEELRTELVTRFPAIAQAGFRSLNEIRPTVEFSVSAKDTIPIAIAVFFESEGMEDLYRKALSMGGDVDTIATMAGSIAAYRYEIPESLENIIDIHLDTRMRETLDSFESYLKSCRPGWNI